MLVISIAAEGKSALTITFRGHILVGSHTEVTAATGFSFFVIAFL